MKALADISIWHQDSSMDQRILFEVHLTLGLRLRFRVAKPTAIGGKSCGVRYHLFVGTSKRFVRVDQDTNGEHIWRFQFCGTAAKKSSC